MRRGRWRGRGEGDEGRSKQGWWECEREGRKRRKAGRRRDGRERKRKRRKKIKCGRTQERKEGREQKIMENYFSKTHISFKISPGFLHFYQSIITIFLINPLPAFFW